VAARRFPIERGPVMMFARACGDLAAGNEGADVAVPPTFVMAAAHYDDDYPLIPRAGREWFGSGKQTGTLPPGGGALHAEQHFTYHRPLRVGDVLAGEARMGNSWDKQGRSGTLRFTEQVVDYRDERGELVVATRSVGVLRTAS